MQSEGIKVQPWFLSCPIARTCFYIFTSHLCIIHPPHGFGPTTFSKIALSKITRDYLNSKSYRLLSVCIIFSKILNRSTNSSFLTFSPLSALCSSPPSLSPSLLPSTNPLNSGFQHTLQFTHALRVSYSLSNNELIAFLKNYHPLPAQIVINIWHLHKAINTKLISQTQLLSSPFTLGTFAVTSFPKTDMIITL